jgi:hypothetical protein
LGRTGRDAVSPTRTGAREKEIMTARHVARAVLSALTNRKDGPSLYDLCDPVL